jgi:tetratricopeptide (TPR) repeat protein
MHGMPEMRRRRNRRLLVVGLLVGGLIGAGFGLKAWHEQVRDQWLKVASLPALEAAARQYPEDEEVSFRLAYRLTEHARYEEARELMQSLVERHPNNPTYWNGFARIVAASGDPLAAADAYRRAADLDLNTGWARNALAQIYAEAGLYEEALPEFEAAAAVEEPSPSSQVLWSESLLRSGRAEQAWERLAAVLEESPMQDSAYKPLTEAGLLLGRLEDLEPLLRRRVGMTTMYPVGAARAPLARLLLQTPSPDRLAEAEELARTAVEDPTPDAAYFTTLGEVLQAKGDFPGAVEVLKQALERDPRHRDALRLAAHNRTLELAPSLATQAREQLQLLEEVDSLVASSRGTGTGSPADAGTQLQLAQKLSRLGFPAEAAGACRRALALAPDHAEAAALFESCRREAIARIAPDPSTLSHTGHAHHH